MSLVTVETVNHKKVEITRKDITLDDEEWFIREFKRSFMFIYSNKTFYITENGQQVLLGPKSLKEKEEWLLETAKEEFNDYVADQKPGYKAIAGWLDDIPIGIVLYRELKDERIIYLAQGFVIPEQQKNGIGSQLLDGLIKSLSTEYKRFDVITRHQNDAAYGLYHRLGFNVGDESIVVKYGYTPMRYVSFYKYTEGYEPVDLNAISLKQMELKDKEWFLNESKKIYKNLYDKKTFFIERAGIIVQLLSSNKKEKDEWIINATNNEFIDYVEAPKNGYKAYVVNYKDTPIGSLLYVLHNDQLLTITEIFMLPNYQKKGFGLHIINNLIPKLHNRLKRIEALVRPQNEIALSFFNKASFVVSDKIINIYQIVYQKTFETIDNPDEIFQRVDSVPLQSLPSLESYTVKKIEEADKEWFIEEYVNYFNNVFKNKTVLVEEGTEMKELKEQEQKNKWFLTRAKAVVFDTFSSGKDRYGVIIEKNGVKCGAVLYGIFNKKIIFFDHFFVISNYYETASDIINTNLFDKIIQLHNTNFHIHALNAIVLHQNDFDSELLSKAGFTIGSPNIVKQYNLNPYLYKAFSKVIIPSQNNNEDDKEKRKEDEPSAL